MHKVFSKSNNSHHLVVQDGDQSSIKLRDELNEPILILTVYP